jgi:dTDP-4-dehydrorhamnose reductase
VPVWTREKCSDTYFISKKEGENRTLLKRGNIVLRTNIFGPANLSHWAITNLAKSTETPGYVNSYFNPVHVSQLSEEIVKIVNKETKPEGGIYSVFGDKILSKHDFILKIAEKLSLEKTLLKECKLPEDQDLTLFPADQLLCFDEGMEILKNEYNNRRL